MGHCLIVYFLYPPTLLTMLWLRKMGHFYSVRIDRSCLHLAAPPISKVGAWSKASRVTQLRTEERITKHSIHCKGAWLKKKKQIRDKMNFITHMQEGFNSNDSFYCDCSLLLDCTTHTMLVLVLVLVLSCQNIISITDLAVMTHKNKHTTWPLSLTQCSVEFNMQWKGKRCM